MQLIVVSNPVSFNGESKLINKLFDNGLEVFHLRKPEISKDEYTAVLKGINTRYHDRVALHQFHELWYDYGVNRLHFSEHLRKELPADGLSDVYRSKVLSTSVHHADDIETLMGFDYAFLGPVFDSYSKPGYKGISNNGFKLNKVEEDLAQGQVKHTKVIALGGIGLNTIGRMKRMGFDGAAMLGWIWNDPLKAIDNFKQVKCWVKDHM